MTQKDHLFALSLGLGLVRLLMRGVPDRPAENSAGGLAELLMRRAEELAREGVPPHAAGPDAADALIAQRVRAIVDRQLKRPKKVTVTCERGCVQLEGEIRADEIDPLIQLILQEDGVREVKSALRIIARHERQIRIGETPVELVELPWVPATRVLAHGLGMGLMKYAAKPNAPLRLAALAVGTGLLVRAMLDTGEPPSKSRAS